MICNSHDIPRKIIDIALYDSIVHAILKSYLACKHDEADGKGECGTVEDMLVLMIETLHQQNQALHAQCVNERYHERSSL